MNRATSRAAVAAALLLMLAGCAPTAPTVDLVPFGERSPDAFSVGDCFLARGVERLDFVPTDRVPCEEGHAIEIVALLDDLDGTELPAADVVDGIIYPQCHDAMQGVVGDLAESPLVTSYTGDLAADGVTIDGPVRCLVLTRNGDIITGSTFLADAHDLIGDWRLLGRLEPGTCFTLQAQNNLGLPTECEPGVLKFLGVIQARDADEFPGTDDLRAQRHAGCLPLIPADDSEIAPATLSGTVPGLSDWLRGVRDITCDVEVI